MREEAMALLEEQALASLKDEVAGSLPYGLQRRLEIARALATQPKLLLLDEITANLDAETEKAVLAALKRVAKDRTVISISHRTSAELGKTIQI